MICKELTDTLGFMIVHTSKMLVKAFNGSFATTTSGEITFEQMGLLYFISRNKDKEMIQQDIAEVMNKTKSAVLRSIDILEEKGFLKRLPVAGDRRKNSIELTESGEKIIVFMHDLFLQEDEVLKKDIDPQELNICMRVLSRVQEKFK